MTRYQVQVTGRWADSIGGWRPAIEGVMNQTGRPAAEASTFDTEEAAHEIMAQCEDEAEEDAIRAYGDVNENETSFRVVEVE